MAMPKKRKTLSSNTWGVYAEVKVDQSRKIKEILQGVYK